MPQVFVVSSWKQKTERLSCPCVRFFFAPKNFKGKDANEFVLLINLPYANRKTTTKKQRPNRPTPVSSAWPSTLTSASPSTPTVSSRCTLASDVMKSRPTFSASPTVPTWTCWPVSDFSSSSCRDSSSVFLPIQSCIAGPIGSQSSVVRPNLAWSGRTKAAGYFRTGRAAKDGQSPQENFSFFFLFRELGS